MGFDREDAAYLLARDPAPWTIRGEAEMLDKGRFLHRRRVRRGRGRRDLPGNRPATGRAVAGDRPWADAGDVDRARRRPPAARSRLGRDAPRHAGSECCARSCALYEVQQVGDGCGTSPWRWAAGQFLRGNAVDGRARPSLKATLAALEELLVSRPRMRAGCCCGSRIGVAGSSRPWTGR